MTRNLSDTSGRAQDSTDERLLTAAEERTLGLRAAAVEARLTHELGDAPTDEELARELGVSVADVRERRAAAVAIASLDEVETEHVAPEAGGLDSAEREAGTGYTRAEIEELLGS